jgi:hypothetical protein
VRYAINRASTVWQSVDDEIALINSETGYYYSLNRTGSFVWNKLDGQAMTFDELCTALAAQYGVPSRDVADDLAHLLSDLARERLIVEQGPDEQTGKTN